MNELIGLAVGFTLTLFVYSYIIIGDRFPYRLAVHTLVGVSAAYAAVVVTRQVMLPVWRQIRLSPGGSEAIYWLVPILFILMLLLRRLSATSWLGNMTLALMMGVGAAVALLGAMMGTLWPQMTRTRALTPVQGIILAVLTVCTLLTFQFTSFRAGGVPGGSWRLPAWQRLLATVGRAVLTISFGALFASVLNTSLILLADRLDFFINELVRWLS